MHIGIIGSGQLAQMLAQAGTELGHSFSFVASSPDSAKPIAGMGGIVYSNGQESAQALYETLGKPDVITVESENVDPELLHELECYTRVAPSPNAVKTTQHRAREKELLSSLKIPVVPYVVANDIKAIESAVEELGGNAIIKSCELGYDGKNQWRVNSPEKWDEFVRDYHESLEVVVEQCMDFSCEVSLIAVRSLAGTTRFYPLTQNRHENGILLTSQVVADSELMLLGLTGECYLQSVLEHFNFIGVMAMECFVVQGKLIVNELAPRVHNSGHWTQMGCETSQFENHIRAITGNAIGPMNLKGPTAMLNLLGKHISASEIKLPKAKLHWYNKDCRPGRKVGHINLLRSSNDELLSDLEALESLVYRDNS